MVLYQDFQVLLKPEGYKSEFKILIQELSINLNLYSTFHSNKMQLTAIEQKSKKIHSEKENIKFNEGKNVFDRKILQYRQMHTIKIYILKQLKSLNS